MTTNDNIYKITDINVTAAAIGKPLSVNAASLFSSTDGYYGPYAYTVTQENDGKKRFKETVLDPVTFEDVTVWHPTSFNDGIPGSIEVDSEDDTRYVYKTDKDYALNLALFLIGHRRGDGFTFAVEYTDETTHNKVIDEYTLRRDDNGNPVAIKKIDPEEILNSVRDEVVAIATANSLRLDAVLDAVSSNIGDGAIKLPISKLTDDNGNLIDLNDYFIASTNSNLFVSQDQATNFIITDDFRNLLATNLGVSSTALNIGDEFFRMQLDNNTNFANIISSNINDQLARNTNLSGMIESIVSTNENLVRTNMLANLATTAQLLSYIRTNDLYVNGMIDDSLISSNVVRTSALANLVTTEALTADYVQKQSLFDGDKLKDTVIANNVARTADLEGLVASTTLFANDKIKDSLISDNVARTASLNGFVVSTNLFTTNGRIDEGLIDTSIMRSSSFTSSLAEGLGLTTYTTDSSLGSQFFVKQITDNPEFGDVISSSISYELAHNTNFENYVADAVAQNTDIVMSSALNAYVQTATLFANDKVKDNLLSTNVAMASNLSGLVNATTLNAYVQADSILTDGKIKDTVLSTNVAMASNLSGLVNATTLNAYVQADDLYSGGKIMDNLLSANVVMASNLSDYVENNRLFTNGIIKDTLLSDNVAKTSSLVGLVAATALFTDDKVKDNLLASNVVRTGALLDLVVKTNLFSGTKIDDNLIPNSVARTTSLSGLVASTTLFADGKIKDSVLSTNVAMASNLSGLVNATTLNAYAQTDDILANGKIKDDILSANVAKTSDLVGLVNATTLNAYVQKATLFIDDKLRDSLLSDNVAMVSDLNGLVASTTLFTDGKIKDSVLSTNVAMASNLSGLVNATTLNAYVQADDLYSNDKIKDSLLSANVAKTSDLVGLVNATTLNAYVREDEVFTTNGTIINALMPSDVVMSSNIATEMSNNASAIVEEVASVDYADFDDYMTEVPIENTLTNLLDVVKDIEIPEIAIRSVMSDYSGYAYCTITNSDYDPSSETARLSSWQGVSEADRCAAILAVDEVNSGGTGDKDARINNYLYLLPNNTLKAGMITDTYIPCGEPPVGHLIDIYTRTGSNTYAKYTGSVTEQDTTPYYYRAEDAIFVVFECYWVKKDGNSRTCHKLPFKHTLTVDTQYLDGTKYKHLGTVSEAQQHMGDNSYISVTKHYLNDSDSDHKGSVTVNSTPYYYYLAVDNSEEPMFSGMTKTYLTQYTNTYKVKIVQKFYDDQEDTTDILTVDTSGDGYADLNEEICELRDRTTGNVVSDVYSPYDISYYYSVKNDYNAEVPNSSALELIENTIAYHEAAEPGTMYVYLFCYKDAPALFRYNGMNIDCYALYFRAYARVNNKITALNWKPIIPYSLESKQFVYPAIIDLTPYNETNAVSTNKNFNTKYPIYMNDFIQVGNTYTNTDNLFVEDGLAMKQVSSWQGDNIPHFRRVVGERTTTMTGDEKVDYFLYHKKTLVTEVPDRVIPESLVYSVNVENSGADAQIQLNMEPTASTATNLRNLSADSRDRYDMLRLRSLAVAYTIGHGDSATPQISQTTAEYMEAMEILAIASVIGKYGYVSESEYEMNLLTTDMQSTDNKNLFYEDSGVYYVRTQTCGYDIMDKVFLPLGLIRDWRNASGPNEDFYTFTIPAVARNLIKVFKWAEMPFDTPVGGSRALAVYNAIYYAMDFIFNNDNKDIDFLVDYANGFNYGSGITVRDGLPMLDYFYNLNTLVDAGIVGSQDLNYVLTHSISDMFVSNVPTLDSLHGQYTGEVMDMADWFDNSEHNAYFQNIGNVGNYRTQYESQVSIPHDPIVSTDRQPREFGLVGGTTTKGFYSDDELWYAPLTYAPYTRTSEPSDWATGEYYTKSGNTYSRWFGPWAANTTFYYQIPRHIKNIFDRNVIVRFLVGKEILDNGSKQRSIIEVRKWNKFSKTWSDMGIEQSLHTAVTENTDVPSYPVPGYEIEMVNERNFEQYNDVIDELRTEVDGNSTLIANKINQLVNVVNGLVFANLAASTDQSFVEFASSFGASLVTPFNYNSAEGAIYDGTTADLPTPPQFVRRVDIGGVTPSTNNVVATNEGLNIDHSNAQVGWTAPVPRGTVKNL